MGHQLLFIVIKRLGNTGRLPLYFHIVYNIILLLKSQYIDEGIHWEVFVEHMNFLRGDFDYKYIHV